MTRGQHRYYFVQSRGRFAFVEQFWSAYRTHERSTTGARSYRERLRRPHEEIFSTVMGRPPGKADTAISFGYRILRKILNPRDTWDRILRGLFFGRSLSS